MVGVKQSHQGSFSRIQYHEHTKGEHAAILLMKHLESRAINFFYESFIEHGLFKEDKNERETVKKNLVNKFEM